MNNLIRAVFCIAGIMCTTGGVSAQELTLAPVSFSRRVLALTSTVQNLPLFSECTFRVRASSIRMNLKSPGRGALLFEFIGPTREQILVSGLLFLTEPLREAPQSRRIFFRTFLSCDTFTVESEIRSFNFTPRYRLRVVSDDLFFKHVIRRVDTL